MPRLLVNAPSGNQELILIDWTGGYFDASRVVWDERRDGPLPDITIGGMIRVEAVPAVEATEETPGVDAVPASLEFSQELLDSRVSSVFVPQSVTMAQAQKALVLAGVDLAAIDAAIDAIPDATARALAQIDWDKSTSVRRDSPLVASLAPALSLTSAQLDQLFITAAAL